MKLRVESICEHLGLISTIARWHYEEWGHLDRDGSLESWTSGLRERTRPDRIPTTFVALDGAAPVGSASLVEHDMATRTDLSPWLAGVFVLPEFRRRGVAARLVEHAVARARAFGVETLYLYTEGARRLYAKLGWRPLGREFYEGQWVTVMSKELAVSEAEAASETDAVR